MSPEKDLQLERAEFEQPADRASCALCSAVLDRRYYQVNGQSICTRCCGRVRASLEGGSALKRGVLAILAGTGAAILGSALYYGILKLTGYEFALIAIVVGFLVGKAVSWGAEGRGGWLYQSIAVVLTYLSIVSAYVPLIIEEVRKAGTTQTDTVKGGIDPAGAAAATPAPPALPVAATTPDPGATSSTADLNLQATPTPPPSIGRALLALALLIGLLLATPFLAGIQNIVGLIIIGIGLYEAWKMNRRRDVVITGPHMIAPPAAAAAPAR